MSRRLLSWKCLAGALPAALAVTLAVTLACAPPARATAVDSVLAGFPAGAGDSATSAAPLPGLSRRLWADRASQGGMLAHDKFLHATASFNVAVDLRLAGASTAASLAGAAAMGVAKELHDWLRPPGPAQGVGALDLVADALGIALAAVLLRACGP